jgi:hypothetical protein
MSDVIVDCDVPYVDTSFTYMPRSNETVYSGSTYYNKRSDIKAISNNTSTNSFNWILLAPVLSVLGMFVSVFTLSAAGVYLCMFGLIVCLIAFISNGITIHNDLGRLKNDLKEISRR